jgi:hypothetical protein
MCPWQVRVDGRLVARCVSADLAHAVVRFLWEQEGVVGVVEFREGVRFV